MCWHWFKCPFFCFVSFVLFRLFCLFCYVSFVLSCFDKLEHEFSTCWSILAYQFFKARGARARAAQFDGASAKTDLKWSNLILYQINILIIAMDRPSKLIVRFCTNSKIEFCVCGAEVALYISHLLPHQFFCLSCAMDTSIQCWERRRTPKDAPKDPQAAPGSPGRPRTPQEIPGGPRAPQFLTGETAWDFGRNRGRNRGRNCGRFFGLDFWKEF